MPLVYVSELLTQPLLIGRAVVANLLPPTSGTDSRLNCEVNRHLPRLIWFGEFPLAISARIHLETHLVKINYSPDGVVSRLRLVGSVAATKVVGTQRSVRVFRVWVRA